ncbi:MAG: CpsB/CapC family capsule biosynthesis tyrosine phosphatase [Bacteroidota bacterium]
MLWLKKKSDPFKTASFLKTDIHSHLIPGLDDGSPSIEESLNICKELVRLGYKKAVTTPHVMQDAYGVKTEMIVSGTLELNKFVADNQIDFEIIPSAEYYADEQFIELIRTRDLLPFNENHLLFETSYLNKPRFLTELIFEIQTASYKPVLAHPERYLYLLEDESLIEDLRSRGVLFQLNINSFLGVYSSHSRKLAKKLWKNNLVDFLGSDCHSYKQALLLEKSLSLPLFNSIEGSGILNNKL